MMDFPSFIWIFDGIIQKKRDQLADHPFISIIDKFRFDVQCQRFATGGSQWNKWLRFPLMQWLNNQVLVSNESVPDALWVHEYVLKVLSWKKAWSGNRLHHCRVRWHGRQFLSVRSVIGREDCCFWHVAFSSSASSSLMGGPSFFRSFLYSFYHVCTDRITP